MDLLGAWFSKLDVLSLIIGAVAGTVGSAWYGLFLKRPVLKVTGGGGGGGPGPGHHSHHVSISNQPGLFGIHLRSTVLFGWRLHPEFRWGVVLQRDKAVQCQALLKERKPGGAAVGLYWQMADGSFTTVADIESGQALSLMLFARLDSEPLRYFVFQPTTARNGAPIVPADEAKLTESAEFLVEVLHSYGNKKLRFPVAVDKGLRGRLEYRFPSGGGSF